MSSDKAKWWANVLRWREIYKVPALTKGQYDPGAVKSSTRKCGKCGNTSRLHRHHKSNDYMFARLKEEWYAERYIQFHKDDVTFLCEKCHQKIHKLYKFITQEFLTYIKECEPYTDPSGRVLRWRFPPSYAVLESFRKRYRSKCERWMKNKIKKRHL